MTSHFANGLHVNLHRWFFGQASPMRPSERDVNPTSNVPTWLTGDGLTPLYFDEPGEVLLRFLGHTKNQCYFFALAEWELTL